MAVKNQAPELSVRDAVPFSVLVGKNLHLKNIRAKRDKPGLRAQHLKGIEASAQICRGRLEGTKLGSKEITFTPGGQIKGGRYNWDIGTAGSATMLALSVIPLALFADSTSNYKITGGTVSGFCSFGLPFKNMFYCPLLREMGADLDLEIIRPGYLPEGKGQIEVMVNPLKEHLRPLTLTDQGKPTEIKGVALSSLLKERKVSERMAEECQKKLNAKGYASKIEILYDTREFPVYQRASVQAGASLAIWARTDTGCLIGSDMAGAPRRSAEFIGKRIARQLVDELRSGATVDRYLADQIIPFMALAEGWSAYLIPKMDGSYQSEAVVD